MAKYKYICSNNPEHTFEEPTPDLWCNICDINTRPMLKPVEISEVVPEPEIIFPVIDPVVTNVPQPVIGVEAKEPEIPGPDPAPIPPSAPKPVIATPGPAPVDDEDKIREIRFGSQTWMLDFWSGTRFHDGTPIYHAKTAAEWANAKAMQMPAWCYPGDDDVLDGRLGLLYNFYVITAPSQLFPDGWTLPGFDDINLLQREGTGGFIAEHVRNGNNFRVSHRLAMGSFVEAGKKRLLWTREPHVVYTAHAIQVDGMAAKVEIRKFDKCAGFFIRGIRKT